MKRTAKIFVGLILLLAGSTFAQSNITFAQGSEKIKPIGFKCESANKYSSTDCSIAQYEKETDLISDGYGANIYTSWYDFAADLETKLTSVSTFNKLNLTFETDIDLGEGYSSGRCYGYEEGLNYNGHY